VLNTTARIAFWCRSAERGHALVRQGVSAYSTASAEACNVYSSIWGGGGFLARFAITHAPYQRVPEKSVLHVYGFTDTAALLVRAPAGAMHVVVRV
jgi:hypothetical protein